VREEVVDREMEGVSVAVTDEEAVIDGVPELEGVSEAVKEELEERLLVGLGLSVSLLVREGVTVLFGERVMLGVAGTAVPLTDAASLPTVKSMPHACGKVKVAE
jgi:hypothetical protein